MRRVVITGMGTVNPLANSVEETWDAVKQGKCGIGPITHFDTTDLKTFPNIKSVNTNAIVEILKQDEALGFTTQEFVKEELDNKKIAIVNTDFDIPTSEYGIYYNKNNRFQALDNLIECIKKECKQ